MEFTKKIDNPQSVIINGLNAIDITNLYHYACEYEVCIKPYPGSFDISNKNLDKFLNRYDIYLNTCAQSNRSRAKKHEYYFLYEQYVKSKASGRDKAHHLLRHIRNSIAHGMVNMIDEKHQILELSDFSVNTGKDTMWAKISVPILYQLITKLIETKK